MHHLLTYSSHYLLLKTFVYVYSLGTGEPERSERSSAKQTLPSVRSASV